jgi:flagellar basal-body rod protein FlgG
MIRSLWTAATGMAAQQMNLDVIANNLANVNTTGFKKSRVDFQDLLYQTIKNAGATQAQGSQIPTGLQVGLGTRSAGTQKMFSQGDYQQTSNPLDMVIQGDGFFQVMTPSGSMAYTRDGAFKVDSTGRLVNTDGYTLQPDITIPTEYTSVSVGSDGTVSVTLPGQNDPQEVGKIELVKFSNPAGLMNLGGNLLSQSPASGDPVPGTPGENGIGSIGSCFLEMSNVKVVEEMVNMIVAQRAYEVNSKAIQASDEMLSTANSLKR